MVEEAESGGGMECEGGGGLGDRVEVRVEGWRRGEGGGMEERRGWRGSREWWRDGG